jgi:outer membrane receptor protein involved in Fe transport
VVDKLSEELGNEDLLNEKVHSFELGYRARLLDERLRLSCDLFYNLYRDTILFKSELAMTSLGTPDIPNSTFRFVNRGEALGVLGGEAELAWDLTDALGLWINAGVRGVVDDRSGDIRAREPLLRLNLGARYDPPDGVVGDVSVHFVSSYDSVVMDPANPLERQLTRSLGDAWLLVGRLGYRWGLGGAERFEAGLTVRAPLGLPFREYAGIALRGYLSTGSTADFGGEEIVRLVSFYLRGSF